MFVPVTPFTCKSGTLAEAPEDHRCNEEAPEDSRRDERDEEVPAASL
jgi:hypothetical protein